MLLEFSVANFRSFRDLQRFSMLAAPIRSNDVGLDENNVFESDGVRALKTKGIYGLNASGKSNLIRAFHALLSMVNRSVADEGRAQRLWDNRFKLLAEWDDQPMFFQLIFKSDNTVYRYGFQIKYGWVIAEWLFSKILGVEKVLFSRNDDIETIVADEFQGAGKFITLLDSGDHEIFRKDSLFLTGAALMGNKLAIDVRRSIKNIYLMDGVNDRAPQAFVKNILQNGKDQDKDFLIELLKEAETGVETLKMDAGDSDNEDNSGDDSTETPDKLAKRKIISGKARYDHDGNFRGIVEDYFNLWESAGTQKWLYTSAIMIAALVTGNTLIIDEFDARFHPNLTLKIVNIFNNPKTNPNNAQLIFATHDTGLLRRAKLRRDQICFVDKDKYGVSSIKTLIEYKGVRKDASYEKEYLEGSYGAVAYLDDIDNTIADFLKNADGLSKD